MPTLRVFSPSSPSLPPVCPSLPFLYTHAYRTPNVYPVLFPPPPPNHAAGDKNPETFDLSQLSAQTLQWIEADSFWCLQHLMEGIQDNYTLAQPGVQAKILALQDLMQRIDGIGAA